MCNGCLSSAKPLTKCLATFACTMQCPLYLLCVTSTQVHGSVVIWVVVQRVVDVNGYVHLAMSSIRPKILKSCLSYVPTIMLESRKIPHKHKDSHNATPTLQ